MYEKGNAVKKRQMTAEFDDDNNSILDFRNSKTTGVAHSQFDMTARSSHAGDILTSMKLKSQLEQEIKTQKKNKQKFSRTLVNKIASWPAVRSFNFDVDG